MIDRKYRDDKFIGTFLSDLVSPSIAGTSIGHVFVFSGYSLTDGYYWDVTDLESSGKFGTHLITLINKNKVSVITKVINT